jgi:hypothetical protein
MNIKKVLGRATLILVAGTALPAVTAGTADAKPAVGGVQPALGQCTPSTRSTPVRDPYGHGFSRITTCNNAPAPVYAANNHGFLKGHLVTRRSFFLCWRPGDFDNGGPFGGSSDWYYTQGDTRVAGASNSWGFVPSSYLDTPDPAAGIPECTFTSVPH